MISYFKYTSGESFTLSGTDYKGLFNITGGRAFTGKSLTSSSQPLSTKGTFIANSFLAKKEFDRTFKQTQADLILTKPHISPKDIIDQSFLNTAKAVGCATTPTNSASFFEKGCSPLR